MYQHIDIKIKEREKEGRSQVDGSKDLKVAPPGKRHCGRGRCFSWLLLAP